MKTGILVVIVLMIIIAGVGIYLSFDIDTPTNINNNAGDTGTSKENSYGDIITTENKNAKIKDFAFSPSTITISRGDTIIWINEDSVKHTVTSDSGNELDSSLLSQGQSYSHTFNTAGTYDYHCTPHPNMKAKVIVQ